MAEVALLVASIAIGVGQTSSGVAANAAAQRQADLQEEQARLSLSEAEREATQKTTERRKFLAEQRMAYLASGVTLVGTPGIVGEETFKEFQQEIDAIRKAGAAQFSLGLKQAGITRSTGRAQLISGFLKGISSVGMGVAMFKSSGARELVTSGGEK